MKSKSSEGKGIKQKPRKIVLTQKGIDFIEEMHTFYKFNYGQYITVTTNNKNIIFGPIVSIFKDYSL